MHIHLNDFSISVQVWGFLTLVVNQGSRQFVDDSESKVCPAAADEIFYYGVILIIHTNECV